MRAWRKLAVVFVAAAAAGVCAAVPAFAAVGVPSAAGSDLRQTRIESFSVPATHEIHGTFDASGRVQALNGKTWQAAASATVALYDRSLPNGKWVSAGSVKAGSFGSFPFTGKRA